MFELLIHSAISFPFLWARLWKLPSDESEYEFDNRSHLHAFIPDVFPQIFKIFLYLITRLPNFLNHCAEVA